MPSTYATGTSIPPDAKEFDGSRTAPVGLDEAYDGARKGVAGIPGRPFETDVHVLREILVELKAIRLAVEPKYDIQFSSRLNLTIKQKRAMALAAIKAMQETET